jgi:hypothetical protein
MAACRNNGATKGESPFLSLIFKGYRVTRFTRFFAFANIFLRKAITRKRVKAVTE